MYIYIHIYCIELICIYILYTLFTAFKLISQFQIFSAWRRSEISIGISGIGTDLPWQTEGSRAGFVVFKSGLGVVILLILYPK